MTGHPAAKQPRRCDRPSCRRLLVAIPRNEREGEEHCPSPACHWCTTCCRRRMAECKASEDEHRKRGA